MGVVVVFMVEQPPVPMNIFVTEMCPDEVVTSTQRLIGCT